MYRVLVWVVLCSALLNNAVEGHTDQRAAHPTEVGASGTAPVGVSYAPDDNVQTLADLQIDVLNPQVRLGEEGQNTAGYMTFYNKSTAPMVLTKAETDVATRVEFHMTKTEKGISRMRPLEKLVIPAGGKLELKTGSTHLMLMRLTAQINEGDPVPVRFVTETGDTITVTCRAQRCCKKCH